MALIRLMTAIKLKVISRLENDLSTCQIVTCLYASSKFKTFQKETHLPNSPLVYYCQSTTKS